MELADAFVMQKVRRRLLVVNVSTIKINDCSIVITSYSIHSNSHEDTNIQIQTTIQSIPVKIEAPV